MEKEGKKVKVLVIEPDFLVRKGIISLLNSLPEIIVTGEGANAREAMALLANNKYDCILTELWQECADNSLLAHIKNSGMDIPVIVLTSSQAAQHLFDAMRLGAQGYLLKNLSLETWRQVILSVMNKEKPIASKVACDILRQFAGQLSSGQQRDATDFPGLAVTAREKEILIHLAQGLGNKEIAEKLLISPNTVKNHIQRLQEKLQVENRTQLITLAVKNYLYVAN